MEERRPDPDLLLKEVQREEERKRQGHLKVFFGAAPGVGKTYAMLEAAWRQRLDGRDVVAGYVEPTAASRPIRSWPGWRSSPGRRSSTGG
jgi:two-component system sensor histidine kinase KdpD